MGYGQNDLKINVPREQLLSKLRDNRERFSEQYKKAKTGYRIELIKELKEKLENAESGNEVDLSFDNQPPNNQMSDYDDIIGMLEWSTDESVQLNHEQYKNYIDDNWDWKDYWKVKNSLYLSASPEE